MKNNNKKNRKSDISKELMFVAQRPTRDGGIVAWQKMRRKEQNQCLLIKVSINLLDNKMENEKETMVKSHQIWGKVMGKVSKSQQMC